MSIPGAASPLFIGAAVAEAAAYQIDRSLRFNSADSAYLSATLGTATDQDVFTLSMWVKRAVLGAVQALFGVSTNHHLQFLSDDTLKLTIAGNGVFTTTAVFRDPAAWYHVVWQQNETAHTLYVNNVSVGTGTATSSVFNTAVAHQIGANNTTNFLDGYLADIHFIDGQALAPTSFGEYDSNNVWQPKAYSGSYGTNGFHLDFSDNTSTTTISEDSSGNNNDWTANNISVSSGSGNDSLIDTPTNYAADSGNNGGNYATLIQLISTSATITNSGLDLTSGANYQSAFSGFGLSSGKWYFEGTVGTFASDAMIGVGSSTQIDTATFVGNFTDSICYAAAFGRYWKDGTQSSAWGDTFTSGDTVSCAFDVDSGKIWFAKNGVWQASGDPAAGTNPASTLTTGLTYLPGFGAGNTGTWSVNFGQRPFAYTPPTGFKSLCTTNLPDPTIADGSTAMDVKLYTGNGSTQTISGLGFSPDLVWIKNRSQDDNHKLLDIVRGATKELESNTTDADVTNSDGLTAFNSDGFDLGDDLAYNTNTESYVAWSWDGGTSTVSNTDGSITSNVRANTSAGFSIVTWTASTKSAATVGHGLNKQPELIIAKSRTVSDKWYVFHPSLDTVNVISQTLHLNTSAASATITGVWGNWSEMTSSTFGIYDTAGNYTNNGDMVAYCFTSVEGYSKFGTYEGNSSTDGPFVYTGFRPRWIMVKKYTGGTGNWLIYDTSRDEFNEAESRLRAASNNAEDTQTFADVLSNGFKIRDSASGLNGSQSYIYAAFGDPFKTARAR